MNPYSNTRQEGESFEDYRLRLRSEKFRVQLVRKGVATWNSAKQGTFTHAKVKQLAAAKAMIQIEKEKKMALAEANKLTQTNKEEQNG